MNALLILKSVLYENRTEQQGCVVYNKRCDGDFREFLERMFGSLVVVTYNCELSSLNGHWFYSFFEPISLPSVLQSSGISLNILADVVLTSSQEELIFLYHIDKVSSNL